MELLHEIGAAPRGTGSAALDVARARCARELETLGFAVRETPFEYSMFPGKYATPVFGAAGAVLVGIAGQLASLGSRMSPAAILLGGAAVLAFSGRWLATHGVVDAPVLRARGVNLEGTRGVPAVWICAHLDSKSQPVPTLLRSFGVMLESVGFVAAAVLALLAAFGAPAHPVWWIFAAVVTLAGAIPVMLSVVTFHSPGALDNASGVATVVAAAALLQDAPNLGVLITDAEELGLAGARVWAARATKGQVVLNCDGVDDAGRIAVMFTAPRPSTLLAAIDKAGKECGVQHDATRLVPGVLTDSVAFADAGLASVTFSRGSWRSLARVHSRRDDLSHLRGTGVAETATLMAHTVRVLTGVTR